MKRREVLNIGSVALISSLVGANMPLLRNDAIRQHPSIRNMPTTDREWEDFITALDAQEIRFNKKTLSPTWVGFSADPGDLSYVITDEIVFMWGGDLGTSNATDFYLTGLPVELRPSEERDVVTLVRNSGTIELGRADVLTNGQITFSRSDVAATSGPVTFPSPTSWTGSGNKGLVGVISYPL